MGVVVGLGVLLLLIVAALLVRRRRQQKQRREKRGKTGTPNSDCFPHYILLLSSITFVLSFQHTRTDALKGVVAPFLLLLILLPHPFWCCSLFYF